MSSNESNGSDSDSDMDQEFMNAMNEDQCQDLDKDEEETEPKEELDDEGEKRINKLNDKTTAANNFLEILGEDILIRICSTLSASHLCEFAKTSRW